MIMYFAIYLILIKIIEQLLEKEIEDLGSH